MAFLYPSNENDRILAVPYNLHSPNELLEPVDLSNVARWFERETLQVESEHIRHIVHHVGGALNEFVRWSERAVLLWDSCDRVPPKGKKQKYHQYPKSVRELAKKAGVSLDSRPNGPAIAAFQIAGGNASTNRRNKAFTRQTPEFGMLFPYTRFLDSGNIAMVSHSCSTRQTDGDHDALLLTGWFYAESIREVSGGSHAPPRVELFCFPEGGSSMSALTGFYLFWYYL